MLPRVVFDKSFGGYVGEFEADSDVAWLHTEKFRVPFGYWVTLLSERRDVFLGYSSASEGTAAAVKRYLLSLGARCSTGRRISFPAARSSIRSSRRRPARFGGIFLFTKDDDLADRGQAELAVPRDNVVFEAGYFIGLKGKRHVLNIRRTPRHAGGNIHHAAGEDSWRRSKALSQLS